MSTKLDIANNRFMINGKLTYEEISECPEKYKGLLMNIRMIQGMFDDKIDVKRFNRFGRKFDPEKNTDDLITSLPEWYSKGIRAITIGLQGGGPCFTINSSTIDNNPFGSDGLTVDARYLNRAERIITAADKIGMVVILSVFYGAQSRRLKDDNAVEKALENVCRWLKSEDFGNVMLEIANEHDVDQFETHPVIYDDTGICSLIDIAHNILPSTPVGCSGTGKVFSRKIADSADVVIIHGNDKSRQRLYDFIREAKKYSKTKPVIINEDSKCIGNMLVAMSEGISWGYYNNMTKQEPPADYGITVGEDAFFAERLSEELGISDLEQDIQNQFYLAGLEPYNEFEGKRWIKFAALYPEEVNYVRLYREDNETYMLFGEPYFVNAYKGSNWLQMPFAEHIENGEHWKAEIHLCDGRILKLYTVSGESSQTVLEEEDQT